MEQKPSVTEGKAANYHPPRTAEEDSRQLEMERGKKRTLYVADDVRYKSDSILAFLPL